MNLQIIPYTEVDGVRTFKDSEIKELFFQTQVDGLVNVVFYDGGVHTADAFLSMMKSPGCLMWICMDGEDTVGYTWLNRFENHTARQHFCFFKDYWGKSIDFGKYGLKTFLTMKDRDGNYIFDLLTGYLPVWNIKARQFVEKCGAKTHGIIPNGIWNGITKQSEPAVFIYYTRECFECN